MPSPPDTTPVVPAPDAARADAVLRVSGLRFGWGARTLLDIPDFALRPGERVFLFGPSGSGKSTLLNLLAGTLAPQVGQVMLGGESLAALPARKRDRARGDHLGFVFQQFNLLPFVSVRENVLLPCRFSRRRRARAIERDGSLDAAAARLLGALGLADPGVLRRRADALSVGQQQRVAAARALIGAPEVVVADEPTSALDADARAEFMRLLFAECAHSGAALLFVSHDRALEAGFDRVLSLPALNRAREAPP